MQTMSRNYRSLSLLWEMHADKAIMTIAIAIALGLGGGLWAFIAPPI